MGSFPRWLGEFSRYSSIARVLPRATFMKLNHGAKGPIPPGEPRSLELIGRVASTVAHEIKSPLAGIYTAIQLIGRDFPPEDSRRQVLEQVGREIRRLDETAEDLLHFARPQPLKPATMDLRTFVGEVVSSLAEHPVVQTQRLRVDIEEGFFCALDTRSMQRVFRNLILNAAQSMQRPGEIRICAERADDRVVVDVTDTGPGIPADNLDRIFEPCFTTRCHGTGLGLAIARMNVHAHSGTIEALPNAPGGAKIRIVLPLVLGS